MSTPTIQDYFDQKAREEGEEDFLEYVNKGRASSRIIQWSKEYTLLITQKALEVAAKKARMKNLYCNDNGVCLHDDCEFAGKCVRPIRSLDKNSILNSCPKKDILGWMEGEGK